MPVPPGHRQQYRPFTQALRLTPTQSCYNRLCECLLELCINGPQAWMEQEQKPPLLKTVILGERNGGFCY